MKEVSKNKRLELLLRAFLSTWYEDILQKKLKYEIDTKQFDKLSEFLLSRTVTEITDLYE